MSVMSCRSAGWVGVDGCRFLARWLRQAIGLSLACLAVSGFGDCLRCRHAVSGGGGLVVVLPDRGLAVRGSADGGGLGCWLAGLGGLAAGWRAGGAVDELAFAVVERPGSAGRVPVVWLFGRAGRFRPCD